MWSLRTQVYSSSSSDEEEDALPRLGQGKLYNHMHDSDSDTDDELHTNTNISCYQMHSWLNNKDVSTIDESSGEESGSKIESSMRNECCLGASVPGAMSRQ